MNKWDNFIHNIKDISSFKDPVTGEVFFGDYDKLLIIGIDKGACFGLTMMWVQAVLCNTSATDNFYRRLNILTNNPDIGWYTGKFGDKHFKSLAEAIYYTRQIVKYTGQASPVLEKYLEIPAFLDSMSLYQTPNSSYHITKIGMQNTIKTSYYTLPDTLSVRKIEYAPGHVTTFHRPLLKIYNQTWVLPQLKKATSILKPLFNYILKMFEDIPIAIVFSANDHKLKDFHRIGIHITRDKFTIFDQNYMDYNFLFNTLWRPTNTPSDILNRMIFTLIKMLFRCFPLNSTQDIIVNLEIYAASENGKVLFKFAKEALTSKLTKYIHRGSWYYFHAQPPEHKARAEYSLRVINSIDSYPDINLFIDEELSLFFPQKLVNPQFMHYYYNTTCSLNNKIDEYYIILIEFNNYIHHHLLTNSTDYNTFYNNMITPSYEKRDTFKFLIHSAVFYENFNLVNDLLIKDIDIDLFDTNHNAPLHYAAVNGNPHILKLLLENNACQDTLDIDSLTPLQMACLFGHYDSAAIFLNQYSNVNLIDKRKNTLLHYTTKCGYANITKLLLEYGANANAEDCDLYTPLHNAVICNDKTIVVMLTKHHANLNARTINGFTALHIAVSRNNIDMIQLLMTLGANINITDNSGKTPLRLAREMDCHRIKELLSGRSTIPLSKDLYALDIRDYNHPPRHTYHSLI